MTLAEKIKLLMKQSQIKSVYRLHKMLIEKFGADALSRRSLTTIMNQKVLIRAKTIDQLCDIFNISPMRFVEDTEIQPHLYDPHTFRIFDKSRKMVTAVQTFIPGPPYSVEKIYLKPGFQTPGLTGLAGRKTKVRPSISIYVLRGMVDIVETDYTTHKKHSGHLRAGTFVECDVENSHCFKNTQNL